MKKLLLATVAVLASAPAFAADKAADYDIVHPFYTPAKGKTMSKTSFVYQRYFVKASNGTVKDTLSNKILNETLNYGATDDVQIGLIGQRIWDKNKLTGIDADRLYINDAALAVGYNVIKDDKTFLNVSTLYRQATEKNANPLVRKEHNKYIGLNVYYGYNFDGFTAFSEIKYGRQVDADKGSAPKTKSWEARVGAFKKFNDRISGWTSLSAGVTETTVREYWWNVGTDYSFAKNMAVGMDAGYLLDQDVNDFKDARNAYRVGMNFTVEF